MKRIETSIMLLSDDGATRQTWTLVKDPETGENIVDRYLEEASGDDGSWRVLRCYFGTTAPTLLSADDVPLSPQASTLTNTRTRPLRETVVAASLKGSVVHAGTAAGGAFDAELIWPKSPPEQREKFLDLMKRFGIPHGKNGRPIPRQPADKLVRKWEVIDPISGQGFKMMKRHLSVSYDLDINELRAMFHLPPSFPVTAPGYSEAKAVAAKVTGLGKGNKGHKTKSVAAGSENPASVQSSIRAVAKRMSRGASLDARIADMLESVDLDDAMIAGILKCKPSAVARVRKKLAARQGAAGAGNDLISHSHQTEAS